MANTVPLKTKANIDAYRHVSEDLVRALRPHLEAAIAEKIAAEEEARQARGLLDECENRKDAAIRRYNRITMAMEEATSVAEFLGSDDMQEVTDE